LAGVYRDANKVLLDVREGGNNMMFLPLDRLTTGVGRLSNEELDRLAEQLNQRNR